MILALVFAWPFGIAMAVCFVHRLDTALHATPQQHGAQDLREQTGFTHGGALQHDH